MIWIVILFVLVLLYIRFKPYVDLTSEGDVVLWYWEHQIYTKKRAYINLFKIK